MERNYQNLYRTGELKKRSEELSSKLSSCDICPRECKINRLNSRSGVCHSGKNAIVSSYCVHFGEEPPLTGENGVGNIFFGNCNLHCSFCQNYQISQSWETEIFNEVSIEKIALIMLELQKMKVSAIGFVSPSHFVPQILEALLLAIENGLNLPLIYNSNGYDKVETLKFLDHVIDIYLPDFKYGEDDLAVKYSKANNYFSIAGRAVKEMYNQVGKDLFFDEFGIVIRGLIIRHLVLPNNLAETEKIFKYIKENLNNSVHLSIMSQYFPTYKIIDDELLGRSIRASEYDKTLKILDKYGFENGWVQDFNSKDSYKPDFIDRIKPFRKVI